MSDNEGKVKNMPLALPRYNIRETRNKYPQLFKTVQKGFEVVTFNSNNNEEVSHIKKEYLDTLLSLLSFKPVIEPDNELGGYTVAVNEIDLYGEGDTIEEAVEDLVNSIQEYLAVYIDNIELISKAETREKNLYLLKLIRCGNKEEIRKALGL